MVTSFIRRLSVVVVALLVLATGAAYASTPTWTETRQHLPADRENLDSYHADSYDVDCVSASYCVAVGVYDTNDPSLPYRGFLDTITATGYTSIAAPRPANARDQPILREVSCPAAGQCVAVGSYTGGSHGATALVETQVAGRWVPQRVGVYPLEHVDCTTAVCAASGPSDISGHAIFAVRKAGHRWQFPALTPPAGAAIASVDGVSCAGSVCYAFGTAYPAGGGDRRSILLLPDGAGYRAVFARTPAGVPGPVHLTDMTCLDESTCYALGDTDSAGLLGGGRHLVLETLSGGTVQVQVLGVPVSVGSDAVVAALQLSCAPGGLCAATAVYGMYDAYGEWVLEGNLLLTTRGHGWHSWHAVTAPNPPGWTNSDLGIDDLSCTSGACVAVGGVGEHELGRPLIESYQNGTWTAKVLRIPAFLPQSGTAAGLSRVSCARAGCLATGGFNIYDNCTCATAGGSFLARRAIKTQ